MFYSVLAIILIILGLAALGWSLKVLLRPGWILGWLRGMAGLTLVICSLVLGLVALDLFSYKQLVAEQSIGTISFQQLGPQRFYATLVDTKGEEQRYELAGDQWQLDVRFIKWPTAMAAVGVKPGYRLDRLSGRYYSLDMERRGDRTVYALNDTRAGIDIWNFFRERGTALKLVDAIYGSATFVPMADSALYEILLSHSGLLARPLNEPARLALSRWE